MSSTAERPWGVEGTEPDLSLIEAVTIDHVRAAAERLRGQAVRTPVLRHDAVDGAVTGRAVLKCESLQRVGAFKFRGGFNALSCLPDNAGGVISYSSGNHAQAIALSASLLGVRAVIVMPDNAPAVKIERTRAFLSDAPEGSGVELFDPVATVREELGRQIAEREGLVLIPPYDHPDVIAGQGTVALELFEQVGELDELYVCCGGGGLLSGCATVAKALCPGCTVIGVEPELGDDGMRSFRDGVLRTVRNPATIADGARTAFLGRYTFPIVRSRVDEMMTVTDAELIEGVRLCAEQLRLVVEPSGVLGLMGAVRRRAGADADQRVGVVISGGNVDMGLFSGWLERREE
jgi:threonine dehydratase